MISSTTNPQPKQRFSRFEILNPTPKYTSDSIPTYQVTPAFKIDLDPLPLQRHPAEQLSATNPPKESSPLNSGRDLKNSPFRDIYNPEFESKYDIYYNNDQTIYECDKEREDSNLFQLSRITEEENIHNNLDITPQNVSQLKDSFNRHSRNSYLLGKSDNYVSNAEQRKTLTKRNVKNNEIFKINLKDQYCPFGYTDIVSGRTSEARSYIVFDGDGDWPTFLTDSHIDHNGKSIIRMSLKDCEKTFNELEKSMGKEEAYEYMNARIIKKGDGLENVNF